MDINKCFVCKRKRVYGVKITSQTNKSKTICWSCLGIIGDLYTGNVKISGYNKTQYKYQNKYQKVVFTQDEWRSTVDTIERLARKSEREALIEKIEKMPMEREHTDFISRNKLIEKLKKGDSK